MKISNHRFTEHWHKASPNRGAKLLKPTVLVMHYTASGGADGRGDADYLSTSAAKASAHIVVGRNGSVHQIVPFDTVAWHAGVSLWRGKTNVNSFSIGIEIDNWGPLSKTEDGKFRSWTGAVVSPENVISAVHKNESRARFWETYPEVQLRKLAEVVEAILEAYPSIVEIVGHDDVSPGRKSDPGPAFPMQRMISVIEGRAESEKADIRRVIASALNVRGGAGTQFERVGAPLPKGATVTVLYDAGRWSNIVTADGRTGWVDDSWLERT